MTPLSLRENSILICITGSQAYGMATSTSDVDIKGVCIPPANILFASHGDFAQNDNPDDLQVFFDDLPPKYQHIAKSSKLEGTVYALKKFLKLAAASNPSIIECLFCRDEEVIRAHRIGKILREHRALFLSAQARHTFQGYAISQLKRIQTHRRWLLQPPTHKPTREGFGLPTRPMAQLQEMQAHIKKQLDRWEWDLSLCDETLQLTLKERLSQQLAEMKITEEERWIRAGRILGAQESLLKTMQSERAYQRALNNWRQYQHWKATRNPIRAQLEAKSGYDTKHASHLVRLMRMGGEILTQGKCNIWRGSIDAQELCAIRQGAWSYEQLIEWTDKTQKKLDHIFKNKECKLPLKPDIKAINELSIRLHQMWIEK